MKQICENYCIELIRAVMQEQPVPEIPEGVTLQALFTFAKRHSVEALVYHGLEQLDMDEEDPVWQNWCNRAQMILTQSIVQLTDRDTIFEALTSEGIDLLPIKGCWLKEQYPEIDYRQMSDLDMFIRKEDRASVCNKMKELGYESVALTNKAVHDSYKKPPYTEVEMHFTLLKLEDSRHSYYDNIWEKAKPVDGMEHLYRMPVEDEYIYYILHLEKHVLDAGIGIKAVLDSFMHRTCYADMDRDYLQNELEKLNVWELTKQIEMLADCWFVIGEDIPEELKELAGHILSDGAYGTEERMLEQRLKKLEERYKNPVIRHIVYWSSRTFLPREEMECIYPILEKVPVLLPFCWIARLVMTCIRKPKTLLRQVKLAGKKGESNG